MEYSEAYDNKINRYLEGRMAPAEEEAFMQQLNEDTELRKLYEEELLINGLFPDKNEINTAEDVVTIPAAPKKRKYKPVIISLLRKYKSIAAAILIAAVITTIFLVSKNNTQPTSITESAGQEKIPSNNDTLKTAEQVPGNTDSLVKIVFDKYYTPYTSQTDPVEISLYYNYYKEKQYNKVLSAKESDYIVMGLDDRRELLNQYMQLYKGLSYLAMYEPAKAIKNFDSVLKTADKQQPIYYTAEWYKALSYLNLKDIDKADTVLNSLINSHSFYKQQAASIAKRITE